MSRRQKKKGVFSWKFTVPAAVILLALAVFFYRSASVSPVDDLLRRAEKNASRINSYHAVLYVSFLGDDEESHLFSIKQWFLHPDLFRIEMEDSRVSSPGARQVFLSDGSKTYVYNPDVEDFFEVLDGEDMPSPYLLEGLWKTLRDASRVDLVRVDELNRHHYFVLDIMPGQIHRSYARQRMWLEKKSLLPVRIEVYDVKEQLIQVLAFDKIEINPRLDLLIFEPKL